MMQRTRLLRRTLQVNGCFSLLSGVLILILARPLAGWMGIPEPRWLSVLGPGLIVFGGLVLVLGLKRSPPLIQARAVIWLDWAWVLGSIGLVSLASRYLTTAGLWLVLGVALVVAAFAALQQAGLRRAAEVPGPFTAE